MTTQRFVKMTLMLGVFCLSAAVSQAEIPAPSDPTESDLARAQTQSAWIQRVQAAMGLLGTSQPAKALAALQAIQQDSPALDRDGVVAVAIGDCHFQLKQYKQARAAYQQAGADHPSLKDAIWVRVLETDLAMDNPDEAAQRLQQILTSEAPQQQKGWASIRLGNIQEKQAIDLLIQAEQTYRQAPQFLDQRGPSASEKGGPAEREDDVTVTASLFSGPSGSNAIGGSGYAEHADDLKDAAAQLQETLQQMLQCTMMPLLWQNQQPPVRLPNAKLDKATISGQLTKMTGDIVNQLWMAGDPQNRQTVELSVDSAGMVQMTVGGKTVELDEAAQRQIVKHLRYTLRLAGEGSDGAEDISQ